MKEDTVIKIVREFVEKQFPKVCPHCNRSFSTLKEYLQATSHIGKPISYDADMNEWKPENPIGTLSYANCPCGNTLIISSEGMGLIKMWRLLNWARKETRKRDIKPDDLLDHIRERIDRQVLEENNSSK